MDWSNERYVRLYVRDTKTWILLGWEGQTVLMFLLRKVDRAGVLDDVFDGEDLAVVLNNGMPQEVVRTGLERLTKERGPKKKSVVKITNIGLVIPNFIEAQETAKSDAQRQRESREKRRSAAMIVTKRDNLSNVVTEQPEASEPVTPTSTVQCSTVHTPESAGARDDSFLIFWKHWLPPRKGRIKAETAWKRVPRSEHEKIFADLERRHKTEDWKKENRRYRGLPASYLNGKRWKDDFDADIVGSDAEAVRAWERVRLKIFDHKEIELTMREKAALRSLGSAEQLRRGNTPMAVQMALFMKAYKLIEMEHVTTTALPSPPEKPKELEAEARTSDPKELSEMLSRELPGYRSARRDA